ncbi:MAG: ferrous iron transport protein B [Bacteriovorax sp.]|nr:ferrous iron transport protein B [Bacteriovorax sp.]
MIKKYIALAGTPNCGKTSLFNVLTGSNQRVGNYPGITVERKTGKYEDHDSELEFVDLPGLYSLDTRTLDERVAKNVLTRKGQTESPLDGIICVVDSTNLERSLYLAFELKKLGAPMIIALNLWDLATFRNQKIDLDKFEKLVGIRCLPISSKTREGIDALISEIKKLPESNQLNTNLDPQEFRKLQHIKDTFSEIDHILKECTIKKIEPDTFTKTVDQYVLHPFMGPIILTAVLIVLFQAIFSWSAPMSDLIESGISTLAGLAKTHIPNALLSSLVADGIISGAGNVFVFFPQIILLFILILLLEDIGYLGRAALMMDAIMRRLGLPGKSVVPLLSSHACSVPGIMATRTIDNEKDRLATMLVAPITTCSARIPVYTLLIASIVPDTKVLGFFNLQGLVMFLLYALGIISSILVAFVLKRTVLTGSASHLLLEIPGYRFPTFKNVLLNVMQRVKIFVKKAGTIILALSIVIWVLVTFPRNDDGSSSIENSYAAIIGKTFTPLFKPIGFDWRLTTALIPTFGAREVVVSTLATVLAVQGEEGTKEFDSDFTKKVVKEFGVPTLLGLLIWFVYSPQCIAMISVFKRESDSLKWTTFMVCYTFFLAYAGAFITYNVAKFLGL